MKIFVFGSNLKGRHGLGAAKYAAEAYGAQEGVGTGPTGNAYAIPTKDEWLKPLPLDKIESGVRQFLDYARVNSGSLFLVSKIGCGYAGYKTHQIAPFFSEAPENVELNEAFRLWLKKSSLTQASILDFL